LYKEHHPKHTDKERGWGGYWLYGHETRKEFGFISELDVDSGFLTFYIGNFLHT